MDLMPLVLLNGRVKSLLLGGTIELFDNHSGFESVDSGKNLYVTANKQMINFTELKIDGTLTLDGDLCLA